MSSFRFRERPSLAPTAPELSSGWFFPSANSLQKAGVSGSLFLESSWLLMTWPSCFLPPSGWVCLNHTQRWLLDLCISLGPNFVF